MKQFLFFLPLLLLCSCQTRLGLPRKLSTEEFNPSVSFYGYSKNEIATFKGYLHRNSCIIDSCYFEYRRTRKDDYGKEIPLDISTRLRFYNHKQSVTDSIAYTDTLFIHTGNRTRKIYNMFYERHPKTYGRYPYSLKYTVDGITTYDDCPVFYKNDYWTPLTARKLFTEEVALRISFYGYYREEIADFKGYLYRNNCILDSCNFEYLATGKDKYDVENHMEIVTLLHFYSHNASDTIGFTDTVFIHTSHKIHKIYNVHYEPPTIEDDEGSYFIKYTIDGVKTDNDGTNLYKND